MRCCPLCMCVMRARLFLKMLVVLAHWPLPCALLGLVRAAHFPSCSPRLTLEGTPVYRKWRRNGWRGPVALVARGKIWLPEPEACTRPVRPDPCPQSCAGALPQVVRPLVRRWPLCTCCAMIARQTQCACRCHPLPARSRAARATNPEPRGWRLVLPVASCEYGPSARAGRTLGRQQF